MIAKLKPFFLHHLFRYVAIPAAVGGITSWALIGGLEGVNLERGGLASLFFAVVLAIFAGMFLVSAILNIDTKEIGRMMAFSFIAGLAYEPVIQKALDSVNVSDSFLSGNGQDYIDLRNEIAELKKSDVSNSGGLTDDLVQKVSAFANDLSEHWEQLDSFEKQIMQLIVQDFRRELDVAQQYAVRNIFDYAGMDEIVSQLDLTESQASPFDRTFEARLTGVQRDNSEFNLVLGEPSRFEDQPEVSSWVSFEVVDPGYYEVYANSESGRDLFMELFDASENFIRDNDDSGGNLNPSIADWFEVGSYLVRVFEFNQLPVGDFNINLVDLGPPLTTDFVNSSRQIAGQRPISWIPVHAVLDQFAENQLPQLSIDGDAGESISAEVFRSLDWFDFPHFYYEPEMAPWSLPEGESLVLLYSHLEEPLGQLSLTLSYPDQMPSTP